MRVVFHLVIHSGIFVSYKHLFISIASIIFIIYSLEFFTSALADGLSLESE